jgi:hypothetical protein
MCRSVHPRTPPWKMCYRRPKECATGCRENQRSCARRFRRARGCAASVFAATANRNLRCLFRPDDRHLGSLEAEPVTVIRLTRNFPIGNNRPETEMQAEVRARI